MKKSSLRLIAWIIVVVATGLTVYFALLNLINPAIVDLFYVIEGTGAVELTIIELSKRLSEPIFLIEPCVKMNEDSFQRGKVGFSVKVKDKTVNNASVICNELPIKWEELDGTLFDLKKLQVGANPSYFFPFCFELISGSMTETEQFMTVKLYQNKSVYDIYDTTKDESTPVPLSEGNYSIPSSRGIFELSRGKTLIKPLPFEANIRITGDEIGEKVNRLFYVHFQPIFGWKMEPNKLEDIELVLRLSALEERFWWKKSYTNDVELVRHNFRMRRKAEENVKKSKG
jgi:hypothetical protein